MEVVRLDVEAAMVKAAWRELEGTPSELSGLDWPGNNRAVMTHTLSRMNKGYKPWDKWMPDGWVAVMLLLLFRHRHQKHHTIAASSDLTPPHRHLFLSSSYSSSSSSSSS